MIGLAMLRFVRGSKAVAPPLSGNMLFVIGLTLFFMFY